MMSVITVMILCMVVAGLLGGLVNLAMDQETKPNWFSDPSLADFPWRAYFREVAISTAAAFLTPLFLSMTDSQLVEKFVGTAPLPVIQKEGELPPPAPQPTPDPASGFLFFGFCLVAALTSKRFIQTVSDSILKRMNDAENKANDAASKARDAAAKADDAKTKADDATHKAADAVNKANQAEGKADNAAGLARDVALGNADPGVLANLVPETAALGQANVVLSDTQRRLLQAFRNNQNRYHFRSVAALAQDAQLSETVIKHDLATLSRQTPALVQQHSALGADVWSLTPAGWDLRVN